MVAQRDEPGPSHQPELKASEIDGVVVSEAPHVLYASGVLTELYRPGWPGVFDGDEPVAHLYTVYSPEGETRDEWYFHDHTLDRYNVLSGRLDVALFDPRTYSPSTGRHMVVELAAAGTGYPNQVRIPPGVWHSLRWQPGGGIFLNAKFPGYQAQTPDKFRISRQELAEHPHADFLLHWADGS